jgi:hypothetical protein
MVTGDWGLGSVGGVGSVGRIFNTELLNSCKDIICRATADVAIYRVSTKLLNY